MAHTPGPWEVAPPGYVDEHYAVLDGFGHTASVYGYPEQEAVALANARLIAAAPELLACLQSLRVVFASLEGWRDMDATLVDQFISSDGLHRVDAAIAKATGKESE